MQVLISDLSTPSATPPKGAAEGSTDAVPLDASQQFDAVLAAMDKPKNVQTKETTGDGQTEQSELKTGDVQTSDLKPSDVKVADPALETPLPLVHQREAQPVEVHSKAPTNDLGPANLGSTIRTAPLLSKGAKPIVPDGNPKGEKGIGAEETIVSVPRPEVGKVDGAQKLSNSAPTPEPASIAQVNAPQSPKPSLSVKEAGDVTVKPTDPQQRPTAGTIESASGGEKNTLTSVVESTRKDQVKGRQAEGLAIPKLPRTEAISSPTLAATPQHRSEFVVPEKAQNTVAPKAPVSLPIINPEMPSVATPNTAVPDKKLDMPQELVKMPVAKQPSTEQVSGHKLLLNDNSYSTPVKAGNKNGESPLVTPPIVATKSQVPKSLGSLQGHTRSQFLHFEPPVSNVEDGLELPVQPTQNMPQHAETKITTVNPSVAHQPTAIRDATKSDGDDSLTLRNDNHQMKTPVKLPAMDNSHRFVPLDMQQTAIAAALANSEIVKVDEKLSYKSGDWGSLSIEGDLKPFQTTASTFTAPLTKMPPADVIVRQLAEAMRTSSTPQTVQIELDPAEMGRVRLNLTPSDGAMTLAVIADRAETAELLRRNIDLLAEEFRDLGYKELKFTFEQNSDSEGQNQSSDKQSSGVNQNSTADTETSVPSSVTTYTRLNMRTEGVDIRV